MSLIHWWPLQGALTDYCDVGLPTCSAPVYATDGILGTCLKLSGCDLQIPNPFIGLNNWSLSFWFRDDGSSDWRDFICWSDNKARLEIYRTGGQWIWYCNSTASGSLFSSGTVVSNSIEPNVWHHIAIIKEGAQAFLYIDGNIDSPITSTSAVTFTTASTTMHFNSRADTAYGKMSLSDVKAYDHALSQVEVKELSRGLAAHYTFNDPYIERSQNYSKMSQWSHYTSYWTPIETTDSGWKLKRTSSSASPTVAISNNTIYNTMAVGDIWTISCYLYKNNQPFVADCNVFTTWLGNITTLAYQKREDGYFSSTFRIDTKEHAYPIHAPFFGTSVTMDDVCEIRYLHVEKNDHATPYTADLHDSTMQNESGLQMQPVDVVDVTIADFSNNGTMAAHFNGDTSYVEIPTLRADMFASPYTLSFWVYPEDDTRAILFGDYLTSGSSNINFERAAGGALRYYHNGTPNKYFTAIAEAGKWNLITVTYKPGVMTVYKNGQKTDTFAYTSTVSKGLNSIMRIGRDSRNRASGDETPLKGYVSDFRFYATCLTDLEVEDLYSSRAYITNHGDIITNQWHEVSDNLFSEREFALPAKRTSGNGTLELRRGVPAYGLEASAYWYADDKPATNSILKGQFKPNTQYYFDLYMDVDSMWYSGESKYVPGGLTLLYTDNTTANITATSVSGTSQWQRVQFYSQPNKTIYGLGVYYWIGTRWYLRWDSSVSAVSSPQIQETYTIQTTHADEITYTGNAMLHDSGTVVGRNIIEI